VWAHFSLCRFDGNVRVGELPKNTPNSEMSVEEEEENRDNRRERVKSLSSLSLLSSSFFLSLFLVFFQCSQKVQVKHVSAPFAVP